MWARVDFFIWATQFYFWYMFVRKKLNKSGVISVQVIEKQLGKSTLVKTIGSSSSSKEITSLDAEANRFIAERPGQISFHFDKDNEAQLVELFFNGIKELSLVGPELLLGKLFTMKPHCILKLNRKMSCEKPDSTKRENISNCF